MAEDRANLKLDTVRSEIQQPLQIFAEKLMQALGDNLHSITVVGSSLTEDFHPHYSDINTVIVLGKQTIQTLKVIAAMAKSMSKKKLTAPLLMTPDYIQRSRDVFGIEFLDFQLIHQTILGDDPFCELTFDKNDVRLQCERELKATLIRLRQGYIAAAANKKLVRDILVSTANGLLPLLRAILWLKDIDRPQLAKSTFDKAAQHLSININPLINARNWKYQKPRLQENAIITTFESIYNTVEQLALLVDELTF